MLGVILVLLSLIVSGCFVSLKPAFSPEHSARIERFAENYTDFSGRGFGQCTPAPFEHGFRQALYSLLVHRRIPGSNHFF